MDLQQFWFVKDTNAILLAGEDAPLLLATPNMRLATKEELAMNEPAKEDAETIGQMLRDPERDSLSRPNPFQRSSQAEAHQR